MRAVCVDDDRLSLQNTLGLCRQMPQIQSAEGFTRARDVLKWMESNPVELAILDIHMPEMDGLALARRIREQNPETAILFLSAHPQYAADAWAIHPTGYVLKPLTEARLAEELVYAAQWLSRPGQKPGERRVEVKIQSTTLPSMCLARASAWDRPFSESRGSPPMRPSTLKSVWP